MIGVVASLSRKWRTMASVFDQRLPGLQRPQTRRLDHRAVGHRVGERHAEFDHVGAGRRQGLQHRERGLRVGIAGRDEGDEGGAAGGGAGRRRWS